MLHKQLLVVTDFAQLHNDTTKGCIVLHLALNWSACSHCTGRQCCAHLVISAAD